MAVSTATTYSRAAIAGNPSDGFDGAVCALVLPFFAATATIRPAESGHEMLPIAATAVSRFVRDVADAGPVAVQIDTSIPQAVGLAGSSAIVIATIRALAHHTAHQLSAMDIAQLAHTVERIDMGIAGGWQDQLVQSHGVSALVECADPKRVEPVDMPGPPIPMYLAWSTRTSESSGTAHTGLRAERRPGDPEMLELANLARAAARALAERDVHSLKESINATFDIRRQIMHIAPAQAAMVDTARELGASANFAGSGGAVVGVLPKDTEPFVAGMESAGYQTATWEAQ